MKWKARIAEKQETVNFLEADIRYGMEQLSDQLQPGRLLAGAARSAVRSLVSSPDLLKDLAALGAVYGAERFVFRKSHPLLKTAGLFAVRKLVSNFIEPDSDE